MGWKEAAITVLIRCDRSRHQLMKSEKAAGGSTQSHLTPVTAVQHADGEKISEVTGG